MEYRKIRISRKMTVGEWLERVIYDLKHPVRLKPTSNYQVYISLQHKLEEEGEIILKPLSTVGDKTFRQLIKWLIKHKKRNFEGTLKTFSALVNRARKARLIKYSANFPYRDYIPKAKKEESAMELLFMGGNILSLTKEQYSAFINIDLNEIKLHGGPHLDYWKELYLDFCIFLYELKSRPIDVLKLHEENFALDPISNRLMCSYLPAKKRNQEPRKAMVMQFLSPEAERIYHKYKGKSKAGYVFPFIMNEKRWNLNNDRDYHQYYKSARNILWRIDKFLHKVGEVMELPFSFTLYVIRRSAITHAIIENKIPLLILAKMAGTSVRMIEIHYTNYLHTLAKY